MAPSTANDVPTALNANMLIREGFAVTYQHLARVVLVRITKQ